ncbi:F-box protein At2g35280-like [Rutidosis leptorrhynchoides]|uniref:F-box protein At2g35280-like n=1 Tax=Rutidosis leptorrhynchoides TaxID=125765 RepID=UPI003A9A21C4
MELTQPKTIENLPQDMLVEILSRVRSYLSDQLFMCKSVCKSFSELSKDPLALKRLSLDRWPLLPWGNPRFFVFLFRCTIFGNPNAIFRWGLIGYLNGRHINYGLAYLKQASNFQLKEAVYVYGLIMFAPCKIEEKHVGLQILNETFPPKSEMVVAVRTRVFDLLRCLWLFNRRPFADVAMPCPISDHRGYFPHIHGFELKIPECMSCFWAYELGVFVNRFAYN